MAEGSGLLNRRRGSTPTVSSNLIPSANLISQAVVFPCFTVHGLVSTCTLTDTTARAWPALLVAVMLVVTSEAQSGANKFASPRRKLRIFQRSWEGFEGGPRIQAPRVWVKIRPRGPLASDHGCCQTLPGLALGAVVRTRDTGAVTPVRSGSGDADRDRASKFQYSVEDIDGDLQLGYPPLVRARA